MGFYNINVRITINNNIVFDFVESVEITKRINAQDGYKRTITV